MTPTQKQIANVMLQQGTEAQRHEVLDACSWACSTTLAIGYKELRIVLRVGEKPKVYVLVNGRKQRWHYKIFATFALAVAFAKDSNSECPSAWALGTP